MQPSATDLKTRITRMIFLHRKKHTDDKKEWRITKTLFILCIFFLCHVSVSFPSILHDTDMVNNKNKGEVFLDGTWNSSAASSNHDRFLLLTVYY